MGSLGKALLPGVGYTCSSKEKSGSGVISYHGLLRNYNVKFLSEIVYLENTLKIRLILLRKNTVNRETK